MNNMLIRHRAARHQWSVSNALVRFSTPGIWECLKSRAWLFYRYVFDVFFVTVWRRAIVPDSVVVPLQGAQKWGKVRVSYSTPCTLKIKYFGWPWAEMGFFFCLHTLAWLNLCYRRIKDFSRLEALGILGWVFMPELLIKSTYICPRLQSFTTTNQVHTKRIHMYICMYIHTYISGGCLPNSPTDRLPR